MAVRGKNISVYLMDGDATGRMKATIANWTGVAYRIPRTALDLCKDRDDLKQSGVYFLFGIDDQSGDNVVYIGQAGARKNGEGVLNRLAEHKRNPDKDYWTEAVVFTTSNNSFGPTEISYLENRFCGMAQSAKRYIVKNENDPTHGNITEEKESELEEFVDFARLIMGVLGHKVFEPLVKPVVVEEEPETVKQTPVLYRYNLKVLKFVYVKSLTKRITLDYLQQHGIVEPGQGPRPFTRITDAQFSMILHDSETTLYM